MLFHGNADMGIGDFLGLTDILEERGLRYCVWDRPGIGFSDFARPRSYLDPKHDLEKFLNALRNRENGTFVGPFFLVGYERGGRDALWAAQTLGPELVSNVLLVDTVLPGSLYSIKTTLAIVIRL